MPRFDQPDVDDAALRGGCALGCVGASMFLALMGLAFAALLALAVGVGESIAAVAVLQAEAAEQRAAEETEGGEVEAAGAVGPTEADVTVGDGAVDADRAPPARPRRALPFDLPFGNERPR